MQSESWVGFHPGTAGTAWRLPHLPDQTLESLDIMKRHKIWTPPIFGIFQ